MTRIENTFQNSVTLFNLIVSKGLTPVFDLDGVVVDATHRQLCNPDGTLNIEKYRENSVKEKIEKDKELPLLALLRMLSDEGIDYYVCTARVLCSNSLNWLDSRGVDALHYFSRGETCSLRDFELKKEAFIRYIIPRVGCPEQILFLDDNEKNVSTIADLGVLTVQVPFDGH